MKLIDDFLNYVTMYRLVLYYLIFLLVIAVILSFFGFLSFSPISLIFSTLFLISASYLTNKIYAKVYQAPVNVESFLITALILALIITPLGSPGDVPFLLWAAIWSMAAKFIVSINKKHIFNPAAFAVALTSLTINKSASWWIGTSSMLPFVFLGGLLIVRKIQRTDLVLSFLSVGLITILTFSLLAGNNLLTTLQKTILDTPLFFFAFIMLTEPLTAPPTKNLRLIYGSLVGFLFAPQIHLGALFSTPELSLIAGNIFSYIVSPKEKLILRLKEKINLSPDIYDFVFSLPQKISFTPGQYMEWTLAHENSDSRGNRRYFTLASSPTEDTLRIGVKFYESSSSFKRALLSLNPDDKIIVASQLSGDFTLPKNNGQKYVFIAGGIGITPFRSILKSLLDTNKKMDIVVFYSNKLAQDIVYKEVFDQVWQKLGIKTVYTLTDKNSLPSDWQGKIGRLDNQMIQEEIPDYKERTYYLSGPHAMVTGFETTLKALNIPKSQIKKDFFPGFV